MADHSKHLELLIPPLPNFVNVTGLKITCNDEYLIFKFVGGNAFMKVNQIIREYLYHEPNYLIVGDSFRVNSFYNYCY